ncbi:zinc finger, CCHC-type containing protein [Tanacetum coccineum]
MSSKNLMQMSTDIVKLNCFDGGSFKRWQKKMQFLLATLNVACVLTKPYPEESKNETLAKSREHLRFENDNFICRGHILNVMSDPLFDVYQNYPTARDLSNALEERYFTEDATNVKKNLKHRKDDLSLKDLGKHLLMEEQYRLENKENDDTSKVHVVEEKGESSKAGGKKCRHDDKDKKKSKKNKKDVICYNCKKPGHFKRECGALKKKQDGGNDDKNKDNNFVAMISETFSLEEEKSWWNLVFGSLLNKFGFKLVFEADKFIHSKGGKFVGKGYHAGGMFKLNIKDVVNSSVNDVNMSEISDAVNASAGIVTNNDAINKMPTSSYYFDSSFTLTILYYGMLD